MMAIGLSETVRSRLEFELAQTLISLVSWHVTSNFLVQVKYTHLYKEFSASVYRILNDGER